MSLPLTTGSPALGSRFGTASDAQRDAVRMREPLRHGIMDRVAIGHALVDNCSLKEACDVIIAHARAGGRPAYVTTANAQHIVLLDNDRRLRKIYDHADLVVPDGFSLLLAARFQGRHLQERITGVDMFQALCDLAAKNGLHVFLLGGLPRSAELAAKVVKRRLSSLRISTYCPPFGFDKSVIGLEDAARAIRVAKPDLLFVGLGAPKQEYWIYEHGLQLSIPVSIGVGGSFEMVAGIVPRAPIWMREFGWEWLYRLSREPRRLWRRYLIGNVKFSCIVMRQGVRRAFLQTFFTFVDKDRFGAELYEPGLQYRGELLASLLKQQIVRDG
jgi:N-acetylglucosaminyldiphosphoundecaprenol N-acetyl-beta-D-mannosaminyltransferase